jgi:hypothetical protein
MLKIRKEQIDTLEQDAEHRFEQKAMKLMRECWEEDCAELSDEELLELVRPGIAKARSYGLEDDRSICNFLNFRFGISHDFPIKGEHDWAEDILSDKYFSSEEKIEEILDEIERRY